MRIKSIRSLSITWPLAGRRQLADQELVIPSWRLHHPHHPHHSHHLPRHRNSSLPPKPQVRILFYMELLDDVLIFLDTWQSNCLYFLTINHVNHQLTLNEDRKSVTFCEYAHLFSLRIFYFHFRTIRMRALVTNPQSNNPRESPRSGTTGPRTPVIVLE